MTLHASFPGGAAPPRAAARIFLIWRPLDFFCRDRDLGFSDYNLGYVQLESAGESGRVSPRERLSLQEASRMVRRVPGRSQELWHGLQWLHNLHCLDLQFAMSPLLLDVTEASSAASSSTDNAFPDPSAIGADTRKGPRRPTPLLGRTQTKRSS